MNELGLDVSDVAFLFKIYETGQPDDSDWEYLDDFLIAGFIYFDSRNARYQVSDVIMEGLLKRND